MRSRNRFLTAILSTIALTALIAAPASALPAPAIKVGEKMGDVWFRCPDGMDISAKDLEGQVVLVEFWKTACGPCAQQAPHLAHISEQFVGKGLVMIGVCADPDVGMMRKTKLERAMTWPQVCDGKERNAYMYQEWSGAGFPSAALFGPDGTCLWAGYPWHLDGPLQAAMSNYNPLISGNLLQESTVICEGVEAAIKDNDSAKAYALFTTLSPAARRDTGKFGARVKDIREKLAPYVQDKLLADVDSQINQKRFADAVAKLRDASSCFAGTDAGAKAKQKLDDVLKTPDGKSGLDHIQRAGSGASEVKHAQKLLEQGKTEQAYVVLKSVTYECAGTPSATQATQELARIPDADTIAKKLEDAAGASGKRLLETGQKLAAINHPDARRTLVKVMNDYAGTSVAAAAFAQIEKLKTN